MKISSLKKRGIGCLIIMLSFMLFCIGRIGTVVKTQEYAEMAELQKTKVIEIGSLHGTIYDCNLQKITNAKTKKVTVVLPTAEGILSSKYLVEEPNLIEVEKTLEFGKPTVANGACQNNFGGTFELELPFGYAQNYPVQLIGYTDNEGHGVSGVEKGMDNLLFDTRKISAFYTTNALGQMIFDDEFHIINPTNRAGVVLTIDNEIQTIVNNAMKFVDVGAAVVVDANNGKIRAMVSNPTFNVSDLAASLSDENSPFLNRALINYNVGSVFKPCMAGTAIENQLSQFQTTCTGKYTVDGNTFRCHKLSGHGFVDMATSIKKSCNCYYYELSGLLNPQSLYKNIEALSFVRKINLGCGVSTQAGTVTEFETLVASKSAMCNISIGQGDLMLSPVALSSLYCCIENGGSYYEPSLFEGIVDENGKISYNNSENILSVFQQDTANILRQYLIDTIDATSGSVAYAEHYISGGKTGTAQTGWKQNDRSILVGWFCGFVEAPKRNYVIVVVKEDVTSGSTDCAPIFKEISDNLYQMEVDDDKS